MNAVTNLTLGELTSSTRPICYGVLKPGPDVDGGVPLVRIVDIAHNRLRPSGLHRISADLDAEFSRSRLEGGEVLISIQGTIGKVAIAPRSSAGANISRTIAVIDPDPRCDKKFLYWYLRHMTATSGFQTVGSTRTSLNISALRATKIPLPPLEEQKRIAGILDQAAELCRLRTRVLNKLNTLGQAIFHEMFVATGSADWATVSVDEITANMRTGPFGSQLLHAEFVEEGIPVLGIDNVVSNEFRWAKARYISAGKYEQLKRYTVLPGDVLITIMGTCGRCAIVPDDIPTAINTKHLCCLSLDRDRVEPKFMQAAFLHHPDVLRQLGVEAKGAVMPGMNMGIIKALKLPLPPLPLQLDFAERLMKVSVAQSTALSAMETANALFASLQHRAFRGEL